MATGSDIPPSLYSLSWLERSADAAQVYEDLKLLSEAAATSIMLGSSAYAALIDRKIDAFMQCNRYVILNMLLEAAESKLPKHTESTKD